MAIVFGPSNAGLPASTSNSTQPSAKMSAAGVKLAALRACSGAMYPGVPISAPVLVMRVAPFS